jgi:hypothetical protein
MGERPFRGVPRRGYEQAPVGSNAPGGGDGGDRVCEDNESKNPKNVGSENDARENTEEVTQQICYGSVAASIESMATIPQQFPPINWQDFQRLALRVLQKLWECPGLEIFARPGEDQYGVDILDLSGKTPLRGAQCKRYEPSEALTPSEIRAEVEKAKAFPTSLDFYAIVTSAKKSARSQVAMVEINREHNERGLFEVVLVTWDDINDFLNENSEIAGQFYGGIGAETAARIERKLNDVIESARASSQTPPSPSSGERYDA